MSTKCFINFLILVTYLYNIMFTSFKFVRNIEIYKIIESVLNAMLI